MRGRSIVLLGLAALLSACGDDASGPRDDARVDVAFAAASSPTTSGTANPVNANGEPAVTFDDAGQHACGC